MHGFCTLSAHRLHICPNRGLFCAWLAQPAFLCIKRRTLSEQGSRQLSAFLCIHQPDGFKDLLTGDFCCRRLFVLPGLGCCRGQVLGIEICLDLLCQFQPGLVETLLVHPDAGADAQYPEILRVVAQTETLAKERGLDGASPLDKENYGLAALVFLSAMIYKLAVHIPAKNQIVDVYLMCGINW